MVVNPSFPPKTVSEFIAYAKSNPGKINMASTRVGNPTHVTGELLKMMAGIDMLHVPCRGGHRLSAALTAGTAMLVLVLVLVLVFALIVRPAKAVAFAVAGRVP